MLVNAEPTHQVCLHSTHSADQIRHRRAPRRISTCQKPTHARRIRNALNSQLTRSAHFAGQLVEEQRAHCCCVAYIALLRGAAGVDDADGAAGGTVGELIVAAAGVLAFGEDVGFWGK